MTPIAGVPVNPGESIQSKVDANPSGTTFVIKAGTHVGQSVVPKSGDSFIGEPGAILDGAGTVICAFCPGSAKPANVRIAQLEIRNYGPASPTYNNVYGDGAIKGGGDEISDGTRGWVVDSNYIHDNRNMGIRIGVKMIVRGNRIMHNAGPARAGRHRGLGRDRRQRDRHEQLPRPRSIPASRPADSSSSSRPASSSAATGSTTTWARRATSPTAT